MRLLSKITLLVPLFSCFTQAFEQQESDFTFALMPIAFTQESIYLDGEKTTGAFPLPELHWNNYYFDEGKLGMTALSYQGFEVDLSLGADYMGDTERGDSKKLKDMTKLSTAITANIDLSYTSDFGELSVGVAQDISDKHDGYSVSASYSYKFTFGQWFVEPSLSITHSSEDLINYYYGVSAENVKSDRAFYEADASFTYETSLVAGYVIDENNIILGFAGPFLPFT